MAIKKTHNEFLKQLLTRNKECPNYQIALCDTEQYLNFNSKLKFKCLNGHPDFFTSPRYILTKKSGCPECGNIITGNKNAHTHSSFLVKLEHRNTRFVPVSIVSGEIYTGIHKKLKFKCDIKNHPEWSATASSILQGSGCPECGKSISTNTHLHTHLQFLNLLAIRNATYPHKKVYLTENEIYVQQNVKLLFCCDKGHTWKTLPGDIIHRQVGCPICENSKSFSFMAINWLEFIMEQENIHIRHMLNHSEGEYKIPYKKQGDTKNSYIKVDGFCEETNTIYEFHGDAWHGNPLVFKEEERCHPFTDNTAGELYEKTILKEELIKTLGYNLIIMWESDFNDC